MIRYVVATIKPWMLMEYEKRVGAFSGNWTLLNQPTELTLQQLDEISPRYIFFPHWSWRVSEEILDKFECVCFHMTDVPFGRGGSPLQNLILGGHAKTKISALRMTRKMDAGPVYLKKALSLEGRAEDIFLMTAKIVFDMIDIIVHDNPIPKPQLGQIVTFSRRTPEQSILPEHGNLKEIYNFIRMLDAPTYPFAFIDWGEFRLRFTRASLDKDTLEATVTITKVRSGS